MSTRALLFDFDGLIVDTETPSLVSWQALYAEHGQELTLERWSAAVGTVGGFDALAHLEELAGPIEREDVLARRIALDLELSDIEQLRPGVLALIEAAERRGLELAIVSSATREWIDRHLTRLERAHHFAEIVTADRDQERAKPRPTLYLEALERLGLDASEAIAFEDSPNGIAAARAAGLFVVGVPNSVTAALRLDEASLVVESLADVRLDELLAAAAG